MRTRFLTSGLGVKLPNLDGGGMSRDFIQEQQTTPCKVNSYASQGYTILRNVFDFSVYLYDKKFV